MKNRTFPRSGRVCRACNSQTCWPQRMNKLLPQLQTDSRQGESQAYWLCSQCRQIEKHIESNYAVCNLDNSSPIVAVTDLCEVLIRASLKCLAANCGIHEELIVPTQSTRNMSLCLLRELARQERWVIGRSDNHEACTKNHGQFPFQILKASLIALRPFLKCKKQNEALGICTIWLPLLIDGGEPLQPSKWPEDEWRCVIRCNSCGYTDMYHASDVRRVKDWIPEGFLLSEGEPLRPEFPLRREIQCTQRCGGSVTFHEFHIHDKPKPRLPLMLSSDIKCTAGCNQNPLTTMHPNGYSHENRSWWKPV
jgi:hypothetical protein